MILLPFVTATITAVGAMAAPVLASHPATLHAGTVQAAAVPDTAPVPTASMTSLDRDYRVRSGDTMSHIAVRSDVSLSALLHTNGMSMNSIIRPGQTITIPGRAWASARKGPARSAHVAERATTAQAKADATGRHRTRDLIVATARRHDIDPELALAIAWQESRWNQNTRSHAGAIGAMQCLPSSGRWMSQKIGRTLDLYDLDDNITCGIALLATLSASATSEREVIAAYYQGIASVRNSGWYNETYDYVASVERHRGRM